MEQKIKNLEEHYRILLSDIDSANTSLTGILESVSANRTQSDLLQVQLSDLNSKIDSKKIELNDLNKQLSAKLKEYDSDIGIYEEQRDSLLNYVRELGIQVQTLEGQKNILAKELDYVRTHSQEDIDKIKNLTSNAIAEANKEMNEAELNKQLAIKSKKESEDYLKSVEILIENIRLQKEEEILKQTESLKDLRNGIVSSLKVIEDQKKSLDERERSIKEIEQSLAMRLKS